MVAPFFAGAKRAIRRREGMEEEESSSGMNERAARGLRPITHNKDNAAGATHKPNSMNSIQSVCLFIRLLLSVAVEDIITVC